MTGENGDARACLLCNSRSNPGPNLHGGYTLRCCKLCGFRFVAPRPSECELEEFYQSAVGPRPVPKPGRTRALAKSIAKSLKKHLPEARKVLEIGCSTGYILDGLRRLGYDVSGTDLCRAALQVGRSVYGLTSLYEGTLPPSSLVGQFDAVVVHHVIEHVLDPKDLLVRASVFLRTNGLLFVGTPNLNSFAVRIWGRHHPVFCPPGHLNFFSATTFRTLALTDLEFISGRSVSAWHRESNDIYNALVAALHLLGAKPKIQHLCRAKCNVNSFQITRYEGRALQLVRFGCKATQLALLPVFYILDRAEVGENLEVVYRKK